MMTCMKGYDDFGLDMTPLFQAKDRAEKGGDA